MRLLSGLIPTSAPPDNMKPEDKFDFYLKKGNEYWADRNFNKALKSFNSAIELNKEDERAWNNKGIVLRNLGNIDEARDCFKKALEINPNNRIIKRNLESLEKPIATGTPSFGFGISSSSKNIFPMLIYEIPRIMVSAVVLVSAILFLTLFLMFKSSESFWTDNFRYLTIALTSICVIIIIIAVITQIHYLLAIIEYEIKVFLIFLLGAVIIMIVPFHEALGVYQTGTVTSTGNIALFILGGIFVSIGTLLFYFKGGYFLPWLLGVIIFMLTSFHEYFRFIVFTETFGHLDQATARIGIIITFIGLSLFVSRKVVNHLLNKSEELRRDGKYKEALKYHDLILKLNPYNEVAWNDKGNVLYTMGDVEAAIDCYNKALKLDDNYDIAKHNLGLCEQTVSSST